MSATTPTTPRARKAHTCDLCCGPIEVGAVYHRWRWYGGECASTVRVHPDCRRVGRASGWYYAREGWDVDSMGEHLRELPREEVAALVAACEDRTVAAHWLTLVRP